MRMASSEPGPPPASEPAVDRRGRRREERRDHVYRTAVRVFIERGYDSTTMEEIAERADVARATVFNHFQRKIGFIEEWSSRRRKLALNTVMAEHLDDHSVSEILARYMTELAKISENSREETVALMGAAVHSTNLMYRPALAVELARYVTRGQQRGEVRASISAYQAGLLLATGYFAVLTQWIGEEPPFDLGGELLSTLDIALGGIVTTPTPALRPTNNARR